MAALFDLAVAVFECEHGVEAEEHEGLSGLSERSTKLEFVAKIDLKEGRHLRDFLRDVGDERFKEEVVHPHELVCEDASALCDGVGVGVEPDIGDPAREPHPEVDVAKLSACVQRPMAALDGGDDGAGEVPLLGEPSADLGVIGVEVKALEIQELHVVGVGRSKDVVVCFPEASAHDQDPNILKKSGHEDLFFLVVILSLSELMSDDGREKRALPVGLMIERFVGGDVGGDAQAEGDGADSVDSEPDKSFRDGGELTRDAKHWRVDDLEELDGERRIVTNHLSEFVNGEVVALANFEDLYDDSGYCWEFLAVLQFGDDLTAHDLDPFGGRAVRGC